MTNPPLIKGFRPYGLGLGQGRGHGHGRGHGNDQEEPVFLLFEEYEALKLCDYDGHNHDNASVIMHISRPTFTRIYAEARRKIAKALVEGKSLVIEGGKVFYDSDWYKCNKCGCYFNNPEKMETVKACPLCGSVEVEETNPENQ